MAAVRWNIWQSKQAMFITLLLIFAEWAWAWTMRMAIQCHNQQNVEHANARLLVIMFSILHYLIVIIVVLQFHHYYRCYINDDFPPCSFGGHCMSASVCIGVFKSGFGLSLAHGTWHTGTHILAFRIYISCFSFAGRVDGCGNSIHYSLSTLSFVVSFSHS